MESHSDGPDCKVVGHRFILEYSFLEVGDLHVVNSGDVSGISWILGWPGEDIPSSVEERKRVSSCWPDSFHNVRMEVAGSKRVCVEDVVKTMN